MDTKEEIIKKKGFNMVIAYGTIELIGEDLSAKLSNNDDLQIKNGLALIYFSIRTLYDIAVKAQVSGNDKKMIEAKLHSEYGATIIDGIKFETYKKLAKI